MKVNSQFLVSATDPARFPQTDSPEIAFLGRSNVGKSSLLNSLLDKKIAHVSATPGRTRAINFFEVSTGSRRAAPAMMFADLPGYGYAQVAKSISAAWPKLIESYLNERTQVILFAVLVDITISAQKSDLQLVDFLGSTRKEFIVVGTKADKLSNNKLCAAVQRLTTELGVASILPYSAKTDTGRKELWGAILSALR